MASFSVSVRNFPSEARPGDIIKDFYLRVYNDTSEDFAVTWHVYVYDAEAGYKLLGSDSFTAYANRTTDRIAPVSFTMPPRDLNVKIKYIAVGKKTNKMYGAGLNMTIKIKQPEIPFDKIQAAVVSAIKRRPIWHQVKENVFLIEVTDTVQQARDGVQSAWLVIDVNTQKMKVKKGVPSDFCTAPRCILQRWLNGQEVQRTTIDGIRYLVTMPCSILILYNTGRIEHAGRVMCKKNMLTWLTWYGYIDQIVEDTVDENIPESFESEESQSDTDTEETEKKDNTFLMLAAGGAALLLIGILLRRR